MLARLWFLVLMVLFTACANTPTPMLTTQSIFQTPQVPTTFTYRIATPFTATENPAFDVVGLDLFDNSPAVIASLKSKGKTVICYFSSQYENWRPDFVAVQNDPALAPLLIGPLDGWVGEQWVDIHNFTGSSTLPQHVLLRKIMLGRLNKAKNAGCDAVDPDNVDEYTNNVSNDLGQAITYLDQYNYNKWFADRAHARGLKIFLKNDLNQIADGSEIPAGKPGLARIFDGAINEECFRYRECPMLKPFADLGKPIFVIEYKLNRVFPNSTDQQIASANHLNVSYYLRGSANALKYHPDVTFGSW
jgi:hypothetical protein